MPLPSAANAAPRSRARSGSISGSGLESARITWPGRTHSGRISPFTPVVAITMSARAMIDSSEPPSPPRDDEARNSVGITVRAENAPNSERPQQSHDSRAGRAQADLPDGTRRADCGPHAARH